MSSFFELIDQAQALLEKSGRVSLRALRRQYSLGDEELEDLAEELVDVRQVATREGNVLQWLATSAPVPPPAAELGERRQLTVMFCDLVGSTALAQQVDPEELSDILTEYRDICDEATNAVGGHVAQYLGDGVMIYFGYPQAQEDAADRAIRAGLEIQRLLKTRHDKRIQARIGIHTGAVVVDHAAAGDKALALGSATNVAARIEGMAVPGTVLVSNATFALCRGGYTTRSLGDVALKGVDGAIELFEILGLTNLRNTIDEASSHPILGRNDEIAALKGRWDSVTNGQGQTVLLVGDAGIGKSRLMQAMRDHLRSTPHLWLDMQCSPFTSGSAFQPVIDLQRSQFNLSEAESQDSARDLLISGVESVEGADHASIIPYLLALLQLPKSDHYPITQTSTGEQRERTINAMLDLLISMTEEKPVVLALEDLHWTDPSTLEFVSRLIDSSADKRLMLLVTSRPAEPLNWTQPNVSTLSLAGLSRESTREMIRHTAGGELPESVLAALESRSDGVPLFISELTINVVGSEGIVEQDGSYKLRAGLKGLSIPMTLQDSLMARLDRLNTSKLVAQQAATLGREFSYTMIASIIDVDESLLTSALAELVDREILTARGAFPETNYTFMHALLQDAAYESQLHSTRRTLHAKIVNSLQRNFPLKVQSEPEVIARHCAAAGMAGEAVNYYHRAAELAEKRLSNREAADHYGLALAALASLEQDESLVQREITMRLAQSKTQVAMYGYEHPDVIANIERIEELCNGLDEGPTQLPALLGLVQLDLAKGANMHCRERGAAILEIAEPLGIPFVIGIANLIMGGTDILLGDSFAGRARLKFVVDIPELRDMPPPATSNDLDLLSTCYTTYASALANCAEFDQARVACEAGITRAKERGNDLTVVQSLSIAALCGYINSDPEYTREVAEEALEMAEGRGFHTPELMASFSLGWAYACNGDIEAGITYIDKGLDIYRETGAVSGIELLHLIGAETYQMAGNNDRASELVENARRIAKNRTVGYQGRILLTQGRLELTAENGDLAKAESKFLAAFELAREYNWIMDQLLSATQLGKIAIGTHKAPAARERLKKVCAQITEGENSPAMIDARQTIDKLAELVAV